MIDDPKRISPIFDPREDARVALAMIREFIELHAPPGTLSARLQTGLRATEEAHALIEALTARTAQSGDLFNDIFAKCDCSRWRNLKTTGPILSVP